MIRITLGKIYGRSAEIPGEYRVTDANNIPRFYILCSQSLNLRDFVSVAMQLLLSIPDGV
jgi:hypothetical protein